MGRISLMGSYGKCQTGGLDDDSLMVRLSHGIRRSRFRGRPLSILVICEASGILRLAGANGLRTANLTSTQGGRSVPRFGLPRTRFMSDTKDRKYWIGFDLGGTKMMAQVYDTEFKLKGKARKKTKATRDVDAGMDRIAGTIAEALSDAKVSVDQLLGIGIGCPGPVDMTKGIVLDPPNLAWADVHMKKQLEKRFPCEVAVLNDVDAGVYGESRFGAGQNARCVLGLFSGTGIGGGCVYEGKIFTGTKPQLYGDRPCAGHSARSVVRMRTERVPGGNRQSTGRCCKRCQGGLPGRGSASQRDRRDGHFRNPQWSHLPGGGKRG